MVHQFREPRSLLKFAGMVRNFSEYFPCLKLADFLFFYVPEMNESGSSASVYGILF